MITSILNGGVGNVLFQVSCAYALARENNDTCAFNFNVPCVNQGNSPLKYRDTLFAKFKDLPSDWKPLNTYKEKSYDYRPIPYTYGLVLRGYFQREAYFAKYASDLVRMFKSQSFFPIWDMLPYTQFLTNSLSIHVRRGDYLVFSDVYVIQPIEYYMEAIEFAEIHNEVEHILVFSDDIEWCKKNMNDKRMIFVEETDDYKCLMLMGLCDANIIANSSFSFWGAYLNEKPLKTIIAPSRWFKDESLNSSEIVPNRWCKI